MKKNDITYEYRVFTNRRIDIEAMEVGKCTSKVIKDLKPKDKVDGRFFHTSDTDEWFFCWNGELQKLNLKGDSDVNAALAEVEKLIGEANAAVNDAKATAKDAKAAAVEAKAAADSASAAVESIENKADKSDVDAISQAVEAKADKSELDSKADVSVVNTLSQTISEKADKFELDSKADASDVKDLSDKVNAIDLSDYAKKSEIEGLASESFVTSQGYLTKSEAESTYAKIGSGSSDGVDLRNYATIEYVDDKFQLKGNYEVAGAAAQALVDAKADAASLYQLKGDYEVAGTAAGLNEAMDARMQAVEGREVYVSDTVNQAIADAKDAAKAYANEEISKLNIPSSDDYYKKDAIDGMLGEINNTLGEINNTLGQALNKTIEILG